MNSVKSYRENAGDYCFTVMAIGDGFTTSNGAECSNGSLLLQYQPNSSGLFFILIHNDMLLEPDATIRDAMLQRIVDTIAQKPVSVVTNRSSARGIPREKRFYIARKSVV